MDMYMVGGAVRDEILGVPSKDIDFTCVLERADIDAINAHNQFTPFEYMALYLKGLGFTIFLETPEYLTVRAQFPDRDIPVPGSFPNSQLAIKRVKKGITADFVLARKESDYTDGRRPDEVVPGTLEDDLARRDFTMNAIAKDSNGNFIDPHNGRADIAKCVIRAVGDPFERLTEDALRAVRALRFSVTKDFMIDADLRFAMQSAAVIHSIKDNISDERIKDELSKMFRFDTPASLIALQRFPILTSAIFAGKVSLDATLKTKGRGK